MQDRNCQAEEWDFKAELKNRIMYLSLYRMCLLEDCGKHLLVNHPDLATFLSCDKGGEGQALEAVGLLLFPPFLGEKSHLAHSWQSGQGLCSACSWPQLSAYSLRTACSPKVLQDILASCAMLPVGRLPILVMVAEGSPCKGITLIIGV